MRSYRYLTSKIAVLIYLALLKLLIHMLTNGQYGLPQAICHNSSDYLWGWGEASGEVGIYFGICYLCPRIKVLPMFRVAQVKSGGY